MPTSNKNIKRQFMKLAFKDGIHFVLFKNAHQYGIPTLFIKILPSESTLCKVRRVIIQF